MSIFQDLRKDAHFYHELSFLGRRATLLTWIKVLSKSRGLFVIAVHRLTHHYAKKRPTGFSKYLFVMAVRFGNYLSKVFAKCDIAADTQFEPGVYLSNGGHIILGARMVGAGTLVHERVTIGMSIIDMGIPEIGRNVWIGSHCVISGDIKIGDGVTVMPYTVLTKSLPPDVLVQGNPARILKRNFDNSCIRQTLTTVFNY